jgi:hypothetical protein
METYIQMKGKGVAKLKLITDELVDAFLGTISSQDFNLNVALDSVNVDDVTVKFSDAKCHASSSSSLLSRIASYFDVKIAAFKSTFKK